MELMLLGKGDRLVNSVALLPMRNAAAKQGSREIPEPESPEPDLDRAGKKAALVGGSGEEGCQAREFCGLIPFQ
jgi:hypothetical protein